MAESMVVNGTPDMSTFNEMIQPGWTELRVPFETRASGGRDPTGSNDREV